MIPQKIKVKRALISVSDKRNIIELARGLAELNIEMISTGGTSKILRDAGVTTKDVSDVTGFPEIMDGRVKTLHPKIHGGILGRRDEHNDVAQQQDIQWIDLVIVNLYPFAETIKKPQVTFEDAIENIDIGGPTMIRSAAKNMEWTAVVVDPQDYENVLAELRLEDGLNFPLRKSLATKAFAHTAEYDAVICRYLQAKEQSLPGELTLSLTKFADLRYGENPHQAAFAYQFKGDKSGILSAKQHQGKQLSYNNIVDADAAFACVAEFSQPGCVIVKHANPCGAAVAADSLLAFHHAFNADAQSAFGGIVALNQVCTAAIAEAIVKIFFEVLIAPGYDAEALKILAAKTNLRVLEIDIQKNPVQQQELKFIQGGLLIQEKDQHRLLSQDLKIVTKVQPSQEQIDTMLFAWPILKFIKSNAILISKENTTLGIGAGQVSRVDAVDIAMRKAGNDLSGAILASDAFFPFRDSIDRLANTGIKAIIQPGGSVRDDEVIAACDENGIAMAFTGIRCFKH